MSHQINPKMHPSNRNRTPQPSQAYFSASSAAMPSPSVTPERRRSTSQGIESHHHKRTDDDKSFRTTKSSFLQRMEDRVAAAAVKKEQLAATLEAQHNKTYTFTPTINDTTLFDATKNSKSKMPPNVHHLSPGESSESTSPLTDQHSHRVTPQYLSPSLSPEFQHALHEQVSEGSHSRSRAHVTAGISTRTRRTESRGNGDDVQHQRRGSRSVVDGAAISNSTDKYERRNKSKSHSSRSRDGVSPMYFAQQQQQQQRSTSASVSSSVATSTAAAAAAAAYTGQDAADMSISPLPIPPTQEKVQTNHYSGTTTARSSIRPESSVSSLSVDAGGVPGGARRRHHEDHNHHVGKVRGGGDDIDTVRERVERGRAIRERARELWCL